MAIFNRILKNKKIYLIMIVQLFLIMLLINSSLSLIRISDKKKVGLENLFNLNTSFIARVMPLGGFNGSDHPDQSFQNLALKIEENYHLFDELKVENLITNHYIYYPSIFFIDDLFQTVKNHKKYKKMSESNQVLYSSKILIDKNFIKKNEIRVKKGRTLNINDNLIDYKTQNVPILLGSDFENFFEIGQIIEDEAWVNNDDLITYKLEVVGIMEDLAIPATASYEEHFGSSVIFGNSFSVIPTIPNFADISRGMAIADSGIIMDLKAGTSKAEIQKVLNKKFNAIGLEVHLYELNKLNRLTQSFIRDASASLALGFILLLLGCIGIINILLASINKRKKEFGLKISCGAQISDITKEFILEIIVSCLIASFFAILFSIGSSLNIYTLTINILLVSIISIITSILPIRKIKSLTIIDLIKESEE